MATDTLPHEPLYDDLYTLRRTVSRLRGDLASARIEVDGLRAELDRYTQDHEETLSRHNRQIVRLQGDLGALREAVFPTTSVYPSDGPPEVVDVEPMDPYIDAPLPIDLEPAAVRHG